MSDGDDDRAYRRGAGRGHQFADRAVFDGSDDFHSGFLRGSFPEEGECALCAAGLTRIKMKRMWVHYVDRRAIACKK